MADIIEFPKKHSAEKEFEYNLLQTAHYLQKCCLYLDKNRIRQPEMMMQFIVLVSELIAWAAMKVHKQVKNDRWRR